MAVIIATIIEMILPEGNNKKYIKLVIGLYVLFSVITPITSAIKGKDYEFNSSDYEKYFNNTYKASSEEISKNNDNNIEKIYTENIKNDIKQKMINKGYYITDLEVVIQTDEKNYGIINKITMKAFKNEEEQIKTVNSISVNKIEINNSSSNNTSTQKNNLTSSDIKEIKQYISDTYNVGEKYIQIN